MTDLSGTHPDGPVFTSGEKDLVEEQASDLALVPRRGAHFHFAFHC